MIDMIFIPIMISIILVAAMMAATGIHFFKRDSKVEIAIDIARNLGWVSASRIQYRTNFTLSESKLILERAKRLGLIYQANDGRFYLTPAAQTTSTNNNQPPHTDAATRGPIAKGGRHLDYNPLSTSKREKEIDK